MGCNVFSNCPVKRNLRAGAMWYRIDSLVQHPMRSMEATRFDATKAEIGIRFDHEIEQSIPARGTWMRHARGCQDSILLTPQGI